MGATKPAWLPPQKMNLPPPPQTLSQTSHCDFSSRGWAGDACSLRFDGANNGNATGSLCWAKIFLLFLAACIFLAGTYLWLRNATIFSDEQDESHPVAAEAVKDLYTWEHKQRNASRLSPVGVLEGYRKYLSTEWSRDGFAACKRSSHRFFLKDGACVHVPQGQKKQPWWEAERACVKLGGHLASIRSRAETVQIQQNFVSLLPIYDGDEYAGLWTGGVRAAAFFGLKPYSEGWLFIDGSGALPAEASGWRRGEPNGYGVGMGAACVHAIIGYAGPGLDDNECSLKRLPLCAFARPKA